MELVPVSKPERNTPEPVDPNDSTQKTFIESISVNYVDKKNGIKMVLITDDSYEHCYGIELITPTHSLWMLRCSYLSDGETLSEYEFSVNHKQLIKLEDGVLREAVKQYFSYFDRFLKVPFVDQKLELSPSTSRSHIPQGNEFIRMIIF